MTCGKREKREAKDKEAGDYLEDARAETKKPRRTTARGRPRKGTPRGARRTKQCEHNRAVAELFYKSIRVLGVGFL